MGLAEMMRQSGFGCDSVSNAYEAEAFGRSLNIWKVDCDTGSYQLTLINRRVHIEEWTGYIFGDRLDE